MCAPDVSWSVHELVFDQHTIPVAAVLPPQGFTTRARRFCTMLGLVDRILLADARYPCRCAVHSNFVILTCVYIMKP